MGEGKRDVTTTFGEALSERRALLEVLLGGTAAMGKLNLIVKVKDTTESEVRKALKAAGIEVRSIVTVYKEEDEHLEGKNEKE